MICAAKPTKGGGPDPQTGQPTPVIGTACDQLNPDGKCGDFVRAGLLTRLLR